VRDFFHAKKPLTETLTRSVIDEDVPKARTAEGSFLETAAMARVRTRNDTRTHPAPAAMGASFFLLARARTIKKGTDAARPKHAPMTTQRSMCRDAPSLPSSDKKREPAASQSAAGPKKTCCAISYRRCGRRHLPDQAGYRHPRSGNGQPSRYRGARPCRSREPP
jgi:hypothetical protein